MLLAQPAPCSKGAASSSPSPFPPPPVPQPFRTNTDESLLGTWHQTLPQCPDLFTFPYSLLGGNGWEVSAAPHPTPPPRGPAFFPLLSSVQGVSPPEDRNVLLSLTLPSSSSRTSPQDTSAHLSLSTSTATSHPDNPKSFASGSPAPALESQQPGGAATVCVGCSHAVPKQSQPPPAAGPPLAQAHLLQLSLASPTCHPLCRLVPELPQPLSPLAPPRALSSKGPSKAGLL